MVDELVDLAKKALTSPGAIYFGKLEKSSPNEDGRASSAAGHPGRGHRRPGRRRGQGPRDARKMYAKVLPPGPCRPSPVGSETFWSISPSPMPRLYAGRVRQALRARNRRGRGGSHGQAHGGQATGLAGPGPPQLPVERPSSVMYVNVKLIVGMIQTSLAIDPGGGFRWSAPRAGQLHLAGERLRPGKDRLCEPDALGHREAGRRYPLLPNAKPLEAKDLAPIPKDATLAKAARFDADRFWETIFAVMAKIDPRAARTPPTGLAEARRSWASRSARTSCSRLATCGASTTRRAKAGWSSPA